VTIARVPRDARLLLLAPAPFVAWALFMLARGALRPEHVALPVVVAGLAVGAAWSRRLLLGLYPFGLVGLLYDAMKIVGTNATVDRIHVCDLRAIESKFFGWTTADGATRTLHDWLQPRAHLALDVYFAVPYATFIFAALAFAAYLFKRDPEAFRRFGWMFFALNVMGFVTYRLYPAAPPWYYHLRGCVVDPLQAPSAGPNLLRVDAFLGIPWFAKMYARSSNVFGAVPSLHVTYPLLIVLEGRAVFGRGMRIASVVYFVSMCVAAVYLDHHWVVDVLLGISYAILARTLVRAVFARSRVAEEALVPAEKQATT
jgi:hypothetical protein